MRPYFHSFRIEIFSLNLQSWDGFAKILSFERFLQNEFAAAILKSGNFPDMIYIFAFGVKTCRIVGEILSG